jgi:endoglucanase
VAAIGLPTLFNIYSSRKGYRPCDDKAWCIPFGRALGRPPTSETGEPALDAFAWVKNPGESDGECEGGPAAGQWFEERALEMAKNAHW